jgi:hypothetical protein
MTDISQDEMTVLSIAAEGQHVAPIGRWKPAVLSLTLKGLMQRVDDVNYTITAQGRIEQAGEDDKAIREILESGAKIENARTQATQSVEQAALHLSYAARASSLITGQSTGHEVDKWLEVVRDRAKVLARNG